MFFIVIAVVGLMAFVWWPSNNTDDLFLSAESNPALPILENAKSTTSPKVLYSPSTEAKPEPAHAREKQPLKTQPVPEQQTISESVREARVDGDELIPPMTDDTALPEVTSTPDQLIDSEQYNEYETREEMKFETTFFEPENPEIQNIAQQLQAMRDAGADEAAIHEAEEKLIQSQQMSQRLQDQQSISKIENDSEALP